jgi:lysophospholipase L1-like esterase
MRGKIINTIALPALPLLLLQGRHLDRRIVRLLPAQGPRQGLFDGEGEPLRLLTVGESTAVGVGVDKIEQAVVYHFARLMNAHSGRAVAWEAAGRPGATVSVGHTHVLPHIASGPRDIVLLLFGANDVLERRHAHAFVQDVTRLIEDLRGRVGNAAILVSSVPPLGTFPALPQPLRAYLGAWSRWLDITLAKLNLPGVHYAPVRIPMLPDLFASDGFHPGPQGYHIWAETLAASAFKFGLVPRRL